MESEYAPSGSDEEEESSQEEYSSETETSEEGSGKETLHSPGGGSVAVVDPRKGEPVSKSDVLDSANTQLNYKAGVDPQEQILWFSLLYRKQL